MKFTMVPFIIPGERKGNPGTHMHTNLNTLSSFEIISILVRPSQINTPNTGMTNILITANDQIAPRGNVCHSPIFGIFNLANADPKQMSPSGTEAAPMKVVASRTNARGGWPSGAAGMNVPGTGVKRALSLGIKAIGKEMRMAVEGGVKKDFKKSQIDCRVRRILRLLFLLSLLLLSESGCVEECGDVYWMGRF